MYYYREGKVKSKPEKSWKWKNLAVQDVAPGTEVQYKYMLKGPRDEVLEWRPGENLWLRVPPSATALVAV